MSSDKAVVIGLHVLNTSIPNPNESGWEIESNVINTQSIMDAVNFSASGNSDFEYNIVTNDFDPPNGFNVFCTGMTAEGCRALMASCNQIENYYNGNSNHHGIDWNLTSNSELTCTNYYPNGNPDHVTGIALHVQNNCNYTFFRGNEINGTITNLHYGPLSGIGSVLVGQQYHHGNIFNGYSAVYNGQPNQVFLNKFDVNWYLLFEYMPWPQPVMSGWFIHDPGVTLAFECERDGESVCNQERFKSKRTSEYGNGYYEW